MNNETAIYLCTVKFEDNVISVVTRLWAVQSGVRIP
jgi:hypothetical protein